jgi:golgin subfamily B member 1
LIVPRRSLSTEHWHDELVHPELEVVTGNILGLIAPAALMGRAVTLRREGKLLSPDESQRQDPAQTTIMAARALSWAAAVMGMPAAPVYTDPSKDVGYAHVPAMPPFSLVGKRALSGRTQLQNAFHAARHLACYRPEFFVKVLFPAVTQLEDLFLAALLIGSPSLPIPAHLKSRVAPISEALTPMLDAGQKDRLRQQFQSFVADGGRTNLQRFSESVDKTACRAGLLLCDDLATVCGLLTEEEGKQGPLLTDLFGFCVSERYARLRRHLGIAVSEGVAD